MEKYDIVFIGAGPGGYVGAIRAAQRGMKTGVVERDAVGGVCLNWGCIPTKAIIASANACTHAKSLGKLGIEIEGTVSPDPQSIWERKNKIVGTLVKGVNSLFKSHGVELIRGEAKLIGEKNIQVGSANGASEIESDNVVLATGSRPAALPGIEPDGKLILTSTDILATPYIPEKLLIVGAGAIGMEFAGIFSAFGSNVTVVEMMPRPLPMEDEDISTIIAREFKKKKVKIVTGEKIDNIEKKNNYVVANLSNGDSIEADRVLVSIGRTLNTDGLGLENAGLDRGKRGEISINEKMETGVPGIYAVGDCVGGPLLAHVASMGGIVAAENAAGGNRKIDLDIVPACTFSHPEVGSVGLREWRAKELGIAVRTGKFPIRALGMAQVSGEIAGEVKVVADENMRVLGMHMVGAGASTVVHEAALAIKAGLTVDECVSMIHAHPSMSEALVEALEDTHGMAVHLPKQKS